MKSELVFALENAGWPALLIDATSTICRANQMAIKLLGAALEGTSPLLSAIWSPENSGTAEQFLAHWERSPTPSVSVKFRTKGGNSVSYLASICAFAQDGQKYFLAQLFPENGARPADLKNPEGSLAQKQKLDCALQLARTVSLDFNNALTSILGHTSLVLTRMEPDHPWRGSLIEVEKSAAKAAEIANDLGSFSHQEKEQRGQTSGNLNSLLQRCVEFFQKNAGPDPIAWRLELDRKLFAAKFDELKMQQTFLRILENAVQALTGYGRITVLTRNLDLSEPTQDRTARLSAGSYVCVEISDNGCGIDPEVLPRIFEPFFTTKRGTSHRGLGLAWVYGIVTNHRGGVAVSSKPGAGTTVRVYLPAEKRVALDEEAGGKDLKGDQTILMVDDEDLVLTMGETVLSAYGYRVLTANSGRKALEMLAQNNGPIDLTITDLVMPGMSGRELVEQIQQLWPGTRILCTSGYVWPAAQESERAYLPKPFTCQELLVKVKQVLSE